MNNPPAKKNRRVLIIDDNRSIHDDFRKILSPGNTMGAALDVTEAALFGHSPKAIPHAEFEVDSAFQGQEGVLLAAKAREAGRPYAMAFVDIRMPPGWDGVETTGKLWELDPNLQVVLCTAYSDYSWGEMFEKLGQRDGLLILKKPFDSVEAFQLAHALTEKWWLHQQSRRKMEELEGMVNERTRKLAHSLSLLTESEARFSGAFAFAPIGVALVSPEGRWLQVNRALCEVVGYSEAELLTRTFQDITHPEDLAADLENVRRVLAGEIPSYQMEKRYVHKRGHLIPILLDVSLVRDDQGRSRYFIAQIQDITELKRNEISALAFSKLSQRLSSASSARAAFDIIKEVSQELFGWDSFCIRSYSAQTDSFYSGFTVDTIAGRQVAEEQNEPMKPGELYRRIMARGGELIRRDQSPVFAPGIIPFGDLSRPSAVLMFVPIRSRGNVVGMLSIQSYTANAYNEPDLQTLQTMADQCGGAIERIWADEALRNTQAQLFKSQKLETVGKLAGGVAHEFNSILTAILGQSELLLGDLPAGSPLVKNATEINKAAGRAATLTRQLLAYGRKQFLRPETLDLNQVVAGMAGMFQHVLGSAVDTQIIPAPGLHAVKADAGQIEHVIMNLTLNARDAMPNGGKLTLETANVSFDEENVGHNPELKPGDYVMLAITDTGTGMTAEVKARAFEPFSSTKGIGQGVGLGLSTSYGIIKQSGGHISVYSEPGRGTTFKIYLPQIASPPKLPLPRPGALELPRGTETILLVEDDPALREMAATLLRRLGYTVLAAANGVQALSLKKEDGTGDIDLLFTDVNMPHMSGQDLAERVQTFYPHTRILFTSAFTQNAIVHQGVLREGMALLQKPFTPSALARKLREVLDAPVAPKPVAALGT